MANNVLRVCGNSLTFNGNTYRCAIGKNGFSANKKEGDNCTPLGTFALRECWVRTDRLTSPTTKLPLHITTPNDGWCDAPSSPDYNRHVTLPFALSHEKLFRDDHVYDLIIPLGYNDDPVIAGKGSAIFLHIAHADYRGTEGCVAVSQQDLLAILPHLDITTTIEITN